jgi:hypothetical protein
VSGPGIHEVVAGVDQIVSDHAHASAELRELVARVVREEVAGRARDRLEGVADDEPIDVAIARAVWMSLSDAKLVKQIACAHEFRLGMCKHCEAPNIGQIDRTGAIARQR